jgi:2-dehydro-3-deoxyphosphooctonate aldolase (KDO 8-P synthase)
MIFDSHLHDLLSQKPFLIAGPCVIESEKLLMQVAEEAATWQQKYNFTIIFKASFDKANRTSADAFRGHGIDEGLELLMKVKNKFGLPILTDIHESWQAEPVAQVADLLQIPAFLCRQTDLLLAAGKTNKIINIKKAQFFSGLDMRYPIDKITSTGNHKILLTERGTMFGYNNLVVDYTNMLDMLSFGYPVVFDATHSVQKPSAAGGKSGGNRSFAPLLARAAAAIGIKAFFIETHPDPDNALSDGPNMIHLHNMPKVLQQLEQLQKLTSSWD